MKKILKNYLNQIKPTESICHLGETCKSQNSFKISLGIVETLS
jgi:hypothetical protein